MFYMLFPFWGGNLPQNGKPEQQPLSCEVGDLWWRYQSHKQFRQQFTARFNISWFYFDLLTILKRFSTLFFYTEIQVFQKKIRAKFRISTGSFHLKDNSERNVWDFLKRYSKSDTMYFKKYFSLVFHLTSLNDS